MTRRGGKRKGAGRPPSPFISRRVVLSFLSEAEYDRFMQETTPRERVVFVLDRVKNDTENW